MNRVALYIPARVIWPEPIAHGYADALTACGWDVILHRATSKYEIIRFIEEYGVSLIFTECRNGIRQLPIDHINRNGVRVAVRAKSFNPQGRTPGPHVDPVDPSDPMLVSMIEHCVVHTHYEIDRWDQYFGGWFNMDVPLTLVPLAGNSVRATPSTMRPSTAIAMVADLADKQEEVLRWLVPVAHRFGRGPFQDVWGDPLWHKMGLPHVRPLINAFDKFANIFGRANVSLNLHTYLERGGLSVNDRTFEIPLCGGYQVTDNPLANKYLHVHANVAPTPTAYIQKVEAALLDPMVRLSGALAASEHVARNHSYFNRLMSIFHAFGMEEEFHLTGNAGQIVAEHHIARMTQLLNEAFTGEK